CDLYARLRAGKGNLFLSPFSVSTALAMTSAGARGTTLDEMRKALHLPEDPHPGFRELLARLNDPGPAGKRAYELTAANAVWAQKGYPWRAEFKETVGKNYGAGVLDTDFARPEEARGTINAWVEKETREKIRELIPKGVITALTRMVLTNAVYFKGAWQFKFDKARTKEQPFRLADGTQTAAPLMALKSTF